MKSMAVPIACVPVAQADTTPKLGPRALCSIATTPEAVLEISAGMRNGDTYRVTHVKEMYPNYRLTFLQLFSVTQLVPKYARFVIHLT